MVGVYHEPPGSSMFLTGIPEGSTTAIRLDPVSVKSAERVANRDLIQSYRAARAGAQPHASGAAHGEHGAPFPLAALFSRAGKALHPTTPPAAGRASSRAPRAVLRRPALAPLGTGRVPSLRSVRIIPDYAHSPSARRRLGPPLRSGALHNPVMQTWGAPTGWARPAAPPEHGQYMHNSAY